MKHRAPGEGGGTGDQGTGTSTTSESGSTESGAANGGTGTGTPAGTEASGTGGQGGGQGTGNEGAQSPFQHEVLKKYKTPTEVEAYVRTLEATVMEQGSQLNAASRAAPAAAATGAGGGSQTPFTNDDFYKDPVKVIGGMLEEAIKPFRQDLSAGRAKTAREELREKYPDFKTLEPAVDTLLRAQGILEGATKESLQFVYFAVKGQMAANGEAAPASTTEQPRTDPVNQQNNGQNGQGGQGGTWFPPQHRPSGSPLPEGGGGGGAPKLRDLTENEERVRREMGKSKEDFLALMDASPTDVATMQLPSEVKK